MSTVAFDSFGDIIVCMVLISIVYNLDFEVVETENINSDHIVI